MIRSKLISNAPHKGIKVGVKLTKEAEAEERLSAPVLARIRTRNGGLVAALC